MASKVPFANDEASLARLEPSHLTFPVVGIGGSAGGLQALQRFFENMPANPGMAFVVILHLSPDHESNAAEILQRASSMPVRQVSTSVRIQANHVYVIAPRADLLMNDGHLQLAPKERDIGPAVAIDVFFRTLAHVHRNHAFAIVLSGTGSDGAVGLARVKSEGGVTFAQEPEQAEHGDMPRAAIATGLVDIVLPVTEMGQRLVTLWANAQHIRLPALEPTMAVNPVRELMPLASNENDEATLQEIMALLRSYTHHDFRYYKRGTVLRRIERRLQVNGLTDLASYRDYLRSEPKEAGPLLQDMLISVTNFFRDHEAFDTLARDVIPELVRNVDNGEQVRIWAAGCATGEESYSLAMLMREEAIAQGRPSDLQIFATDIDERALSIGRRGIYPSGIATDVSPERLRQFFVREHDQFRIQTSLREQVLFATHNLLRDPPFSRLDLICCRNLLIYLDQSAQASVLEMFHYALKPGGYLLLGTSESTDPAGARFIPVDKKNRIYRADASNAVRAHSILLPARAQDMILPTLPRHIQETPSEPERLPSAQFHTQAILAISPASVLVSEQHDILHLSPTAGRYLEHGAGVLSANLLSNVDPELRLELRTALFQSAQSGDKVESRVARTHVDGTTTWLNIAVHPFAATDTTPARTLVVFEERKDIGSPVGDASAGDSQTREATHHQMMGKAESEIKQLKVNLQDTLERSALSTEELRAANEELQAINEELRSATEELETSKEELQSMNEELTTVNFELRMKVEERGQINDDLQNLIASSEIATVFVDSGLRVKRFTPQASKLFSLIASDAGRSLMDITNRLNYGALVADTETVFKDLRPIEQRITTTDGKHFLARILPYRTVEDKIEGAVLTFIDITNLHVAEEKVRAGEERLRLAAATTHDFAIITTDADGAIASWNTGAERAFGYAEEEILGHPIAEIFTPEDRADGVPEEEMRLARETGRAEDERWHLRKDGTTFYCSGVLTQLQDGAGSGFAKIARDMTGSKRHELARENLLLKEQQESTNARMANDMKDRFLAVMSHELKQPLNLIQVNAELLTRLPETKVIVPAMRIGMTIQRAVASQSRIINDLLDLSRMRTGKLRLHPEAVDLHEVVQGLAEAIQGDIRDRHLDFVLESDARLACHCDPIRVEQIIWNLLSNAIKFTPDHGRVTLRLVSIDGWARITVADSGVGLLKQALPHIFELFSQMDVQGTRGNNGLGIGLALVQELVHAHGGRVEVASDGLGLGATFSVWLPMLEQVGGVNNVLPSSSMSFDGLRMLTVDDDQDSLNAFAALLQLEGAVVDAVGSSAHALELIEANTYDLMISDIAMPDMNGMELISEVRRRWPERQLLAISMSGYGRPVDALKSKTAGFDIHISKPTSLQQLKAAVAQHLNGIAGGDTEGSLKQPLLLDGK